MVNFICAQSINMPIHSSSNYLNHPTLIKLAKVLPLLIFCKFLLSKSKTWVFQHPVQSDTFIFLVNLLLILINKPLQSPANQQFLMIIYLYAQACSLTPFKTFKSFELDIACWQRFTYNMYSGTCAIRHLSFLRHPVTSDNNFWSQRFSFNSLS
jgi:hypothetical protein